MLRRTRWGTSGGGDSVSGVALRRLVGRLESASCSLPLFAAEAVCLAPPLSAFVSVSWTRVRADSAEAVVWWGAPRPEVSMGGCLLGSTMRALVEAVVVGLVVRFELAGLTVSLDCPVRDSVAAPPRGEVGADCGWSPRGALPSGLWRSFCGPLGPMVCGCLACC